MKNEYIINDSEFNLAKMELNTIKLAFKLHPKGKLSFIATLLGISERTLNRKINQYKLSRIKLRTQCLQAENGK